MASSMDKPTQTIPNTTTSTPPPYPNQIIDPSMQGANFNQLIQNRGIRFEHSRAISCPNIVDLEDNNHLPNCELCDNSGIIYYSPKEIIGAFLGNSMEKTFEYNGVWETGTAVVTFPTEYSDGILAEFAMYDRLKILDYTVRLFEKKEYKVTTSDLQQLRYPIQKIEYLIAVINGVIVEYVLGTNFTLDSGKIKWVTGFTPPVGQVLSISYYANPYYIVLNPLRELRVTQQMINGQKTTIRLPQQIVIKRDYFLNKNDAI
jgi:hypothetical protein